MEQFEIYGWNHRSLDKDVIAIALLVVVRKWCDKRFAFFTLNSFFYFSRFIFDRLEGERNSNDFFRLFFVFIDEIIFRNSVTNCIRVKIILFLWVKYRISYRFTNTFYFINSEDLYANIYLHFSFFPKKIYLDVTLMTGRI